MAKTEIKIEIEDREDGARVTINGELRHDFQQLYSAMGFATWAVVGADTDNTLSVSLSAGDWLPKPTFVDN
jgi:hypothetical protein